MLNKYSITLRYIHIIRLVQVVKVRMRIRKAKFNNDDNKLIKIELAGTCLNPINARVNAHLVYGLGYARNAVTIVTTMTWTEPNDKRITSG